MRAVALGLVAALGIAGGAAGQERKAPAARPATPPAATGPAAPGEGQVGLSAYIVRRSYGCALYLRVEHSLPATLDLVEVTAELRVGRAGEISYFTLPLIDAGRPRWADDFVQAGCPPRGAWLHVRRVSLCRTPPDCGGALVAIAPPIRDRRFEPVEVRIALDPPAR